MTVNSTVKPVSVVSVDDHHLIREGIANLISSYPTIELVGEGKSGEDVLALMEKHKPNVLLLDLNMPQSSNNHDAGQFQPLPTITKLLETYKETYIIILTQQFLPIVIEGAIERGVKGYILKSDDLSLSLPAAILTVAKGGVYFSETISSELFAKQSKKTKVSLTSRQIEVLTQIATNPDLSYAEHALSLGISESTLKGHLTNSFKALGVKNVTAAIIRCMQIGIIPRPESI